MAISPLLKDLSYRYVLLFWLAGCILYLGGSHSLTGASAARLIPDSFKNCLNCRQSSPNLAGVRSAIQQWSFQGRSSQPVDRFGRNGRALVLPTPGFPAILRQSPVEPTASNVLMAMDADGGSWWYSPHGGRTANHDSPVPVNPVHAADKAASTDEINRMKGRASCAE